MCQKQGVYRCWTTIASPILGIVLQFLRESSNGFVYAGVARIGVREVEVFELDCMTQNGSEDSLRILGPILEELDKGLLCCFLLSSSQERERSVTS
jgi:hypothetical protein